jgi:hypothetical protein
MDNSKSKVEKSRPKTGGRAVGVPNKATALAREAFAAFVDGNAHRFQGWLDEVADDPKHGAKVALELVLQVSEYHIPKLARTEHVGDGGGPVELRIALIEKFAARRAKKDE